MPSCGQLRNMKLIPFLFGQSVRTKKKHLRKTIISSLGALNLPNVVQKMTDLYKIGSLDLNFSY